MYTTSRSFYIGVIRQAVDEFADRFSGFGELRAVASHISDNDFTAQGYAEASRQEVIVEVERIAVRIEAGRKAYHDRVGAAHERFKAGEIDWSEFEEVLAFGA